MGIILFGDKAQKAEIKRLRESNVSLARENASLEDAALDTATRITRIKTSNRDTINEINLRNEMQVSELKMGYQTQIQDLESGHEISINELENDIEKFEESFTARVDKEVSSVKKDFQNKEKDLDRKGDANEKAHTERMKRLEADYAAKIAKCDRELEADKVSYRKYIKSEFNTRVETLEKDNKRLLSENISLSTSNANLKASNSVSENQIKSLTELNASLVENIGTLSSKIVDGLVKGMPTVSAEITTPEVNVHVPAAATSAQAKQNVGGEQKKS